MMNERHTPMGDTNEDWVAIRQAYIQPQPRSTLMAEILQQREHRQLRRASRFRYAAAALLLMLLPIISVMVYWPHHGNTSVAMQRFKSVNTPQRLKFIVNAAQSHEQVTFSLRAPAQWSFYGYRDQQVLNWHGKLKAGSNLLSIPLVAHKAVAGTLVVTIRHKDAVKQYRIPVDVAKQPA